MAIELNNKIQFYSDRVRNGPVGFFFRWWFGELKQLLPEQWQERLQHAFRRFTFELREGELRLGVEENHSIDWIESSSMNQDVALQRQQISALAEKHDLISVPRFLLLDQQEVLRKELVLPAAAEANLKQVLTFEMDRQTPFRAADVYFTWLVLGNEKDTSQIRLALYVVPRAVVDSRLESLTSRGLAPSGIDIIENGQTIGVNLLPTDKRQNVVNPQARLNYGLGAAALILLLVVMAQSLNFRENRLNELEAAIGEVQGEARRVQGLREQLEETSEAASFLTVHRAASPIAVEVMADVTGIIPDDTFLDRLVINADNILMQGKSSNAQQLIEIVNKSELFENAGFRGSTRLDTATGLEIFEVNADISPRDGS
jgi:general secretion pathway protein L